MIKKYAQMPLAERWQGHGFGFSLFSGKYDNSRLKNTFYINTPTVLPLTFEVDDVILL